MHYMNRRKFISQAAIGAGGALILSQMNNRLLANPAIPNADVALGFQTYPIRSMLAKDFSGVLKTMAGFGYKYVEMCSPPGYVNAGFGFLVDTKPADIRKTIEEAGLNCPSCHFGFKELTDKLDDRIAFSKEMDLSYMVCSSFGLPKTATLKDYLDAADKLNLAGEKIRQAGMQAGYHNHDMEFATLDGQLIYDALMARFKPELVKMQFQTEVINLGFKASTYFRKYPGRFFSSHLSDWTSDKKQVPIGKGIIDWKDFFEASKVGGLKYYFVEMDFDTFKDSAAFILGK
ncbi:MAG: xylose isomerase [Bacteroidetes bacterium]|nr:MAG: xylose isomerase [Bacteroidota bacterium]